MWILSPWNLPESAVQMLLVFPVEFYIQPDPEGIAMEGTLENSGIHCRGVQGIIFCQGILFQKACRGTDHFHPRLLWCGEKILCKGICFLKL